MIKRFLTASSPPPTSPRWLRKLLQTYILLLCMDQWAVHVRAWPALCEVLSVCITAEASQREQNPAGSEWVLLSDDRWPVGNLENPNCVLSETATAGTIILSLLNLSPFCLFVSLCMCAHARVSMALCVCACVRVLLLPWKPSEPEGAVKNQYSSAALPLYSFNNSLPLHYCPLISHHRA